MVNTYQSAEHSVMLNNSYLDTPSAMPVSATPADQDLLITFM